MHPADETIKSKVTHVYAPAIVAAIAVLASLAFDVLVINEIFWFQRSGAIMTAVGVYIAFHESKQFFKVIVNESGGVSTFINPEIPYKWLALVYAILGTAIWGYGDIPFQSV